MTCKDCRYYQGKIEILTKTYHSCALTRMVVNGEKCPLYNVDLSNSDICYNCKHYLGGNDWGLSCAKHYNRLTEALHEVCEDFSRKDNKNEARN